MFNNLLYHLIRNNILLIYPDFLPLKYKLCNLLYKAYIVLPYLYNKRNIPGSMEDKKYVFFFQKK